MNILIIAAVATTVKVAPVSVPPAVFRCAGNTQTCRTSQFTQQQVWDNLKQWSELYGADALGLGSPWSLENAKATEFHEWEYRDRYYAGQPSPKLAFDENEVKKSIDAANALGTKTLFYVDNECPKQRFGHVWYVGFKVTMPNWYDHDQGLLTWFSSFDDDTAAANNVIGKPHRRRTYRKAVDEQRAAGALAIWAHPTEWSVDKDGRFRSSIAVEMIPELLEDGYLDGMSVVTRNAYNPDCQALWFALLDRGYRVPGFAETDMSVCDDIKGPNAAFFNLLKNDGKTKLSLDYMKHEYRKARHTMSSGPVVFLSVDDKEQGDEIADKDGAVHTVKVSAFPAKGEKKLSKVELLGRGGKVLATVPDFAGGEITFEVKGSAEGGYLVVRAFGENGVRHCALTNPVWLRTDKFRAPAPIQTDIDHMSNPSVRDLMDYLANGDFRKDYKDCAPGSVPVAAWRIDEMAEALVE